MSKELRPLRDIAVEIRRAWTAITPAARPWVNAMAAVDTVTDTWGKDTGKDIIENFLKNCKGFEGEDAARLKNDLEAHLGVRRRRQVGDRHRKGYWRERYREQVMNRKDEE